MKPKTKIEKQVVAWANSMPPASRAQRKWAFSHLFKATAKYFKKGEAWCLNCGHIEPIKEPPLAVSVGACDYTCPHCGEKLAMEHWNGSKTPNNEGAIFSVLTTSHGWQVIRTFEVMRCNKRGEPTKREFHELFQHWVSPEGKEVIASKAYSRAFYYHTWYYDSPFEIKRHNAHVGGYYAYNDVFDLSGITLYPRGKVLPLLSRNGWTKRLMNLYNVDYAQAMRRLLMSNDAETLVKSGQIDMFCRMVRRGEFTTPYRHAVNVCNRNGYTISDADIWVDYLDLLAHFGLDTHNAHYVCPERLHDEHNKLVNRKRREEDRKRIEEKRKEAAKFEEQYAKKYGKFLGVAISDGDITCHVLQSVAEFVEEGEVMHHCVYANGYFDAKRHPNALILSARGAQGERIETVEINLKTLKVVQSRGRMNKATPKHKQIVDLINSNMHLIREAK